MTAEEQSTNGTGNRGSAIVGGCDIGCSVNFDSDQSVFRGDFPSDIHEKYDLMKEVLGEGSFGTVRKCRNKLTRQICALKTIEKAKLPDSTQLRREIDILSNVDHPHIIKLYDVYEDNTVSSDSSRTGQS